MHHSRLYKLKTWLTLEGAASHLSSVLSEPVGVDDLLQLAIEKRLKLSVRTPEPFYANKGSVHSLDNARVMLRVTSSYKLCRPKTDVEALEQKIAGFWNLRELNDDIKKEVTEQNVEIFFVGNLVSQQEHVIFSKEVLRLPPGVYDLPMLSSEVLDIEAMYSHLVHGEVIETVCLDGMWVEQEGCLYRMCELATSDDNTEGYETLEKWQERYENPDRWCPADSFPGGSSIIVRRKNLDSLIACLEEPDPPSESNEKLELADSDESDAKELKASEALGLLIEALRQNHPALYARPSGDPKKSGIYGIMTAVVEEYGREKEGLDGCPAKERIEVHGFKESTLDRVLDHAIEAWAQRKERGRR